MSWNLFLDIVFAVIVLGAIPIIISLEWYCHKTKVSAVSSLPWMRKAVLKALKEHVGGATHNHGSDSHLTIYEMGSGWGPLAVDAAKAFPDAKVIGLEFSPVPVWFSRIRAFIFGHRNLTFKRADFFEEDLRDADVILLYMLESILVKLKPKFEEELKPGTLIISNTFKIEGWEPVAVEEVMKKLIKLNVYIYRVPEREK
ncbi:MAG: methyltransferase domain-containing protein [Pseudomonadota bacterium]